MPRTKALGKKLHFRFMHTTECVVHKKTTLGFCLTVALSEEKKLAKIITGRLLHVDVQSWGHSALFADKNSLFALTLEITNHWIIP